VPPLPVAGSDIQTASPAKTRVVGRGIRGHHFQQVLLGGIDGRGIKGNGLQVRAERRRARRRAIGVGLSNEQGGDRRRIGSGGNQAAVLGLVDRDLTPEGLQVEQRSAVLGIVRRIGELRNDRGGQDREDHDHNQDFNKRKR